VSELYTCELCKLVLATRESLFEHYKNSHNLSNLFPPTDAPLADKDMVVLSCDGEGSSRFMTWEMMMDADRKQQDSQDRVDTTLMCGDIERNVADETSSVSIIPHVPVSSVSSKTRSRSLLKAAKRTMLNSAKRDLTSTRVHHGFLGASQSKVVPTRRPPILRGGRSPVSMKQKSTMVGVPPAPVHSEQTATITKSSIEYLTDADSKKDDLLLSDDHCLLSDFNSPDKEELATQVILKEDETLPFHNGLEIVTEPKNPVGKARVEGCSRNEKKSRKMRHPRKMERQDLPGVYPCNQCGKTFMKLRYLRLHGEMHRNDKQFVCDECGKIFKCRGYLRVHMRRHEKSEKVFRCNQCDFTSSINAVIHAHRQIHSQGSVLCDTCGYAYTDKATLAKHKRVHDPNRPFACNFPGCTWRFKTEIMCKAHIRAHTTEGKFRCSYCGYVFRHKHHLQRHESNMHGVKHSKSRTYSQKSAPKTTYTALSTEETESSVNIIISTDYTSDGLDLHENGISQQFLVIHPDDVSEQLAYETTDITSLTSDYSLIQSEDIHTDNQTA